MPAPPRQGRQSVSDKKTGGAELPKASLSTKKENIRTAHDVVPPPPKRIPSRHKLSVKPDGSDEESEEKDADDSHLDGRGDRAKTNLRQHLTTWQETINQANDMIRLEYDDTDQKRKKAWQESVQKVHSDLARVKTNMGRAKTAVNKWQDGTKDQCRK